MIQLDIADRVATITLDDTVTDIQVILAKDYKP